VHRTAATPEPSTNGATRQTLLRSHLQHSCVSHCRSLIWRVVPRAISTFISSNTKFLWKADRSRPIPPYLRSLDILCDPQVLLQSFLRSTWFITYPLPKYVDEIYAICRPLECLPLIPRATIFSYLNLSSSPLAGFDHPDSLKLYPKSMVEEWDGVKLPRRPAITSLEEAK